MKISIKSIVAVIALSALFAGPASATVVQSELNQSMRSAIGTGSSARATIDGDTVTVLGYFDNAGDQNRALNVVRSAVRSSDDVKEIINLSRVSN